MKLEDISSPEFLKQLNIQQLNELAEDIRKFLLEKISKNGGHLSSNLGVVETTIALHYVFTSPHDKIIFDVGHQAYVHKILTGRAKDFDSLRKKNGLSGFLKYSESNHDVWEAGHSSTSLSAAAGFVEAKASGEDIGEIVTLIGDGSVQNGLAFEALNYIGSHKSQKVIIIINDNDMSISMNVGRLAKSFSKIRIKKSYFIFKKMSPRFVQKILRKFKNALRGFVYDANIFSAMGYKYYGPIDGHNIKELIRYFEFAKESPNSVVLHIKTTKGKGYCFSEKDSIGTWHGVKPFDLETGESLIKNNDDEINWGLGICHILNELADKYENFKVISPAMISGSNLLEFQELHHDRLIDVGIAEEHAVVMAAGMARNNVVPFVSIYATFMQRAYDEISHDVCRSNNHVIFLVDRAGLVSGDGSTHQGIFDIAMLSHLPNMVITMPKDLNQARLLISFAYGYNGPIAIRYPKGVTKLPVIVDKEISLGKWDIELPISEVNIITYGPEVDLYKERLMGKNIGLINAFFIKPIDEELLLSLKNKRIIIVEEVVRYGSLESLILEYNNRMHLQMDIESFAIDDQYVDNGSVAELKKDLKIDIDYVIKKINER